MISKHDPDLLYDILKKYSENTADEYARRLPVYETFKWWARRYAAIFRGTIEYVKEIGAHTILDPFMGGGTIVFEAVRQGMQPTGIELNPYPEYQISTLYSASISNILKAGDFLVRVHEKIWPTIWKAEYNGKTYEIIHTILERSGTKIVEKEYELYDHNTGKRIFVDAGDVSVVKGFDDSLKLPEIPEMKETRRLIKQGFKRFDELMTSRQRATIKQIIMELRKQPEPIQQIIISAIADSTRTLSILAYYSRKYKKIIPGFIIKSYWLPKEPAELNPLAYKPSKSGPPFPIGRGNLFSLIRKLYRARIWGEQKGYFKQEPTIFVGDSEEILNSINNRFDAVITDPPYFDTQSYQDLSAFSLAMLYTEKELISKKNTQIYKHIIQKLSEKDLNPNNKEADYFSKLERIFRKLKSRMVENAPMIFSFHHRNPEIEYRVWKAAENMFAPIAIYVVPGESSGKLGRGAKRTDFMFYFANTTKGPKRVRLFWVLPKSKIDKEEYKKIENFVNMISKDHLVCIAEETQENCEQNDGRNN